MSVCSHKNAKFSTFKLQVEGLRNEYNRVTSGASPKTSSNVSQSGGDHVSQPRQEAQQLQAIVSLLKLCCLEINQHINVEMFSALSPV